MENDLITQEEIQAKLNETTESENEEQKAQDNKNLETILNARQEVFIDNVGKVIFDFPGVGLSLQGDEFAAKFRTKALRSGEYMTEAELKAIHGVPVTRMKDGKEVVVADGEWPEKNDSRIEELDRKIKDAQEMFDAYRADYQENRDAALGAKGKAKEKFESKRDYAATEAATYYKNLLLYKQEQLELNAKRARLFADSLEERTFLEKVKFFAPSCIKREQDGKLVPLWKSEKEMLESEFISIRVLTLFNLFLRGLDVSFFGDVPEGTISS